jgi:hypothetical protein
MFDVDLPSISGALQERGSALRERLVFTSDRLGIGRLFDWLKDKARRKALTRVSALSDHDIRVIGIEHRDIDSRADDLVKCLRVCR